MSEQKIKQDSAIPIGKNIRVLRLQKGLGQTDLVRLLQLAGQPIARESLVKIEGGRQHLYASQLRALRDVLDTSYDELLKG